MTSILAWFLGNPTVLAIVAGFVGAIGWGWKQRRAGAKAERARQAEAEARARDISDDVDADMHTLTPEQRRERLRQWQD